MVFFSSRISPFTSTVIFLDRSPLATAVVTSAMLRTWPVRLPAMKFTRVGQILPGAGDALHVGLAAELAFGADFAGHARHFGGERAKLIHHRVDGVLELQDFALDVDGDLLATGRRWRRRWSLRRCCAPGTVRLPAIEVHGVGEVLPRAGDALHVGLAAELAFGADFAGHAGHFRRRTNES